MQLSQSLHTKNAIATIIAFAFHFFGYLGMKNNIAFFYNSTPLHLLVCAGLLFYTHKPSSKNFYWFFIAAFCIGFGAEWIGVNTGWLFGDYWYGAVMGWGIGDVPISIGLNWFTVLYCSCVVASLLNITISNKILSSIVLSSVAASIATTFDYCIEPGATKLSFWNWQGSVIPVFNYVCWWGCSFVIALLFFALLGKVSNKFAIGLLLMQVLFFLLIG
jgi:bisanhydrobacterioruberin hydratase